MKFLQRWFDRMIRNSWERARNIDDAPTAISRGATVRARDSFETDTGLNMQVFKAIGGKIVSFNIYDHKTDRNYRTVYIITDEQDFERELGKMITMESMKA